MGLDMYAYTIREDLVEGLPDYGIHLEDQVLKALNYEFPAAEPTSAAELQAERERRRIYIEQAIEDGLYNPDFAYWRKFNHLHGWMEQLYSKKCPPEEQESFNCVTLRLRLEDLEQLEQDAPNLCPTAGFFFGSLEPLTPEDLEEIQEFIAKARAAIAAGYAVFYDSWW